LVLGLYEVLLLFSLFRRSLGNACTGRYYRAAVLILLDERHGSLVSLVSSASFRTLNVNVRDADAVLLLSPFMRTLLQCLINYRWIGAFCNRYWSCDTAAVSAPIHRV
jgi:hypothetical protein